jgi:hypothetical protein
MLTPITWRDRITLIVIVACGIGGLVWWLPWAAQHPFLTPPEQWSLVRAGGKRSSEIDLMNLTPVIVGIAVVFVCVLLYCAWMSFWSSRPIVISPPRRR